MVQVTLASGLELEAEPGVPILDAAERHGARLEYSCRTGRCSSCKARVAAGETEALHAETGLEPGEAEAGWILTCVRSATSDVVLAEDNEIELDLPRPAMHPLRVNSIERVCEDIVVVRFRLPPTTRWSYVPGQHLEMIGPGGVRRAYSMANAPRPDGVVELHIKHFPDGAMSEYWFNGAAPDDLLRLHGPLGTFVLRDSDRPLVFLATSTGIAPVKAMLEALLADGSSRPVRVYFGGRTQADIYWRPTQCPADWQFVPVLSRADPTWTGRTGYVQHALLADVPDLTDVDLYACGSDTMIHDSRGVLTEAGLDPRRFFADAFVESAPMGDEA